MSRDYIDIRTCRDRVAYSVDARYLQVGVFCRARTTFIGLSAGCTLYEEVHRQVKRVGTAAPRVELPHAVPEDVSLELRFPVCADCQAPIRIDNTQAHGDRWQHVEPADHRARADVIPNEALRGFLAALPPR